MGFDPGEQTLQDLLFEIAGGSQFTGVNARRLGHWLADNQDRITDGYCLRTGKKRQRASLWWVEDLHEVSSVSLGESVLTDAGKKKGVVTPIRTVQKELTKTHQTHQTGALAGRQKASKPSATVKQPSGNR